MKEDETTDINQNPIPGILFENQIQTTSASPCRTQVQPAASFLVCSLIFIEYKSLFKCQKCQHDSINDKELNGLGVDDFFHAKTSFSLETFPQRDMFVVKVRIVFS